jgi:hypothetical protein
MKVSELIIKLQQFKGANGDLPVCYDDAGTIMEADDVEVSEIRKVPWDQRNKEMMKIAMLYGARTWG